ncbi:hypothetical protein [Nocardiopsis sp. NPDC006832]
MSGTRKSRLPARWTHGCFVATVGVPCWELIERDLGDQENR